MKIYLDMDGVLADFDAASRAALGTDNPYKWEFTYGTPAFWSVLDNTPNFWEDIPPTPYATELYDFALQFGDVSILTALPRRDADKVIKAKTKWIHDKIDLVPVITCLKDDKKNWSEPGAVLVDDRNIQIEPWESKGGIFVHHQNIINTKKKLREAAARINEDLSDRFPEESQYSFAFEFAGKGDGS